MALATKVGFGGEKNDKFCFKQESINNRYDKEYFVA